MKLRFFFMGIAGFLFSIPSSAVTGEMGTGKPSFGVYSAATGMQTVIWSLKDATISFPGSCNYLLLTPATMGLETYKIALSILITAKATNAPVRFFATVDRDGGCGIDFVQMM
jgi:hypothetical protein